MRSRSGFTLIELLITITIIAILSAIGLVSYITFVKNSRDVKRQSDLKFIQSALEQYHADQKYYPYQLSSLSSGTKTYLTNIPTDPSGSTTEYQYSPSGTNCAATTPQNCTSYCLYAKMDQVE